MEIKVNEGMKSGQDLDQKKDKNLKIKIRKT